MENLTFYSYQQSQNFVCIQNSDEIPKHQQDNHYFLNNHNHTDENTLFISFYEKLTYLFNNETKYDDVNFCCNCKFYLKDLEMAAELGKNLLERNHELQSHIYTLQQVIGEKNSEIKLLEKHYSENKEALELKLRHLEQIDYQNNELEKQLNFYKNSLEKEKLKFKDLGEAYTELSQQYDELNTELKNLKIIQIQSNTTHSVTNDIRKAPTLSSSSSDNDGSFYLCNQNQLKKSKSETNLNEIQSSNFNDLKEIYEKWHVIFDSYCKKKLNEYKLNINKLLDDNLKIHEQYQLLDKNFQTLNKSYNLLLIDFEESQSLNSNLEKKLEIETPKSLDDDCDYIENDEDDEKLKFKRFLNFNSEIENDDDDGNSLGLAKKDAETQIAYPTTMSTSTSLNQITFETAFSSYKDIFKQIYETLNTSKAI